MKIKFMSKKKKDSKVVTYNPENEITLDVMATPNKYIFPMKKVDEEDSNVAWIGYIEQSQQLFIQYKVMKKTPDGYDIGLRDEPIGYYYHDVPKNIFDNLLIARSKGQYINNIIKKNFPVYHREYICI